MTKRLFVFNPEHDLVLAREKQGGRPTPPRAARLLRRDLGFLPAFMAEDGDWVMVDDVEVARRAAVPFAEYLPDVQWMTPDDISRLPEREKSGMLCCPWGWDEDVRCELLQVGMNEMLIPSQSSMEKIRRLSHRAVSIGLLDEIVKAHPETVGERREATCLDEVYELMRQWHKVVVKAPWSSSGRGVRFIDESLSPSEEGYIRHVLEQQKSVIVEPYYDCMLNFALEFSVKAPHTVPLDGISIFTNAGAAYTGNLLAAEQEKRAMLEKFIGALTMLDIAYCISRWLDTQTTEVKRDISYITYGNLFRGPVGVDMMLVRTPDGIRIHPCVEINMRCTMGHVALHVQKRTHGRYHSMSIKYDQGQYSLILK